MYGIYRVYIRYVAHWLLYDFSIHLGQEVAKFILLIHERLRLFRVSTLSMYKCRCISEIQYKMYVHRTNLGDT